MRRSLAGSPRVAAAAHGHVMRLRPILALAQKLVHRHSVMGGYSRNHGSRLRHSARLSERRDLALAMPVHPIYLSSVARMFRPPRPSANALLRKDSQSRAPAV